MFNCFKVIVCTQITKGHHCVKIVDGITDLIFCISSDNALYFNKSS